jgi:hypothetical protein
MSITISGGTVSTTRRLSKGQKEPSARLFHIAVSDITSLKN